MKGKIFMYLFFFAALFIIYQYMNEKRIFESQEHQIASLNSELTKAKDSVSSISNQLAQLDYFTLQGNENAMTYFESLGQDGVAIENRIKESIYDQNVAKGGNPLVPYEGINGPMRINKVKFLNNRWIIADFTDGRYWGEMILEYFINENSEIELNKLSSVLYQN